MRISQKPELGPLMTFELSKQKPIHGWFWYKEGFAPEIVEFALRRESRIPQNILDPFCGVGTALLAAKKAGIASVGVDASPLAVFASTTKTQDYGESDIRAAEAFLEKTRKTRQAPEAKETVLEGPLHWEFELFDPRAAFPKRNYNEILSLRYAIEQEEGKARDLLLLALLSILPQASIVLKDGGVLKIKKQKRAMPAKEIFRRRVKAMVRDLGHAVQGPVPDVFLGDARALDLKAGGIDLIVTSPPYLNNIDYSKIYGLELSLLDMGKSQAEEMRMRAVRSFIRKGKPEVAAQMPPEVGEIGYRIPIIGTYFSDMEKAIAESYRVLSPKGACYVVVSNSVIHETHVLVDEILAEIAERLGFSDVEIAVGAERIADVRPQKVRTRESVVIMKK